MASEKFLEGYKVIIQALSEKYEVTPRRVWNVLADISNEELASLDWKDLDVVVQEGLAGYTGKPLPEDHTTLGDARYPEGY